MRLSTKKTIQEIQADKNLNEPMNGFQVLKYTYAENSSVIRNLFLKKFTLNFLDNTNNDDDNAVNRTLLLINVPPFFNEHHAKFVFEKRCDKIQKVFFEQKPSLSVATSMYEKILALGNNEDDLDGEYSFKPAFKSVTEYFPDYYNDEICGYKACYIVFATKNGVKNALQMTQSSEIPYIKKSEQDADSEQDLDKFCTGLKKMELDYNRNIIAPKRIMKDAEAFISNANVEAEEELSRIKQMADMKPDPDGWVTVNRNLRRNRQALVSNKFKDQKIKQKYTEREEKRKLEEEKFEQSVDQSMLTTGNKKKKKRNAFVF